MWLIDGKEQILYRKLNNGKYQIIPIEDNSDMNKFLVIGNIIKNPNKSVAKPGIIKRSAAKAIAAPEIISYVGEIFFLICKNPDLRVFNPSYFA